MSSRLTAVIKEREMKRMQYDAFTAHQKRVVEFAWWLFLSDHQHWECLYHSRLRLRAYRSNGVHLTCWIMSLFIVLPNRVDHWCSAFRTRVVLLWYRTVSSTINIAVFRWSRPRSLKMEQNKFKAKLSVELSAIIRLPYRRTMLDSLLTLFK